jgi:hypothetical protein
VSDQRIVVMDARQAAGEHGDEFQELIDQYDAAPERHVVHDQLVELLRAVDSEAANGRFPGWSSVANAILETVGMKAAA